MTRRTLYIIVLLELTVFVNSLLCMYVLCMYVGKE